MTERLGLNYDPFSTDRQALPGVAPLDDPGDWAAPDADFAAQMAERDRLIAARPSEVWRADASAAPAVEELAEITLDLLAARDDYAIGPDAIRRPDGVEVPRAGPALPMLGRLVQSDLCVMERPDGADEHVLTAAVVCFPANWRLAEKFLRPLSAIHAPVGDYDAGIARRVQRLFDGVRPGKPLWRANAHRYGDPSLHQPGRPEKAARTAPWLRTERQVIQRLPRSGAALFAIRTRVFRLADGEGESLPVASGH